uniref:Uncharacterized protein n=1 Tax=Siphoviridae sp. ctCNm48 TaxID=2825377 RepID=A0A8S5TW98_9CAUD|nr:MAG TPA: hypothetical protein [Siphoviridae sp. ctCNm48]
MPTSPYPAVLLIDDLQGNRPPRNSSGAVILCPARNGVLMAFCGLLLLGGIGTPPPMQHALTLPSRRPHRPVG